MQAGPPGIELGAEFITIAPLDEATGRTVEKARVMEGRMPSVTAAGEVALNELAASQLRLGPGDGVTFQSRSADQLRRLVIEGDPTAIEEEPDGPNVDLVVTGIVRLPGDVGSADSDGPFAVVTPAFHERYGSRIGQFGPNALLRLRDGYADVPEIAELVQELAGNNEDVAVDDTRTEVDAVKDALRVQSVALLLFAAVAALAGIVAVGQALVRELGAASGDGPTLRALGLTRSQRTGALLTVVAPSLLVGAVLAAVLALAASTRLPLGLARRAEPDPGFDVDALVLGLGMPGWLLLMIGCCAAAAWPASRVRSTEAMAGEAARPTLLAQVSARLGSPVTITGLRMAFGIRRGTQAVPVRAALVGTAAAVAGLLAVLTFSASLDHLLETPGLSGYPWHAEISGGEDRASIQEAVDGVVADPDTDGVLVAHIVGDLSVEDESVQAFGVQPAKGEAGLTIVSGREPRAPDEVALGATTLRRLDRSIGDTVRSRTREGEPREFVIVGSALFPVIDDSDYTHGALFTHEALLELDAPTGFYDALGAVPRRCRCGHQTRGPGGGARVPLRGHDPRRRPKSRGGPRVPTRLGRVPHAVGWGGGDARTRALRTTVAGRPGGVAHARHAAASAPSGRRRAGDRDRVRGSARRRASGTGGRHLGLVDRGAEH